MNFAKRRVVAAGFTLVEMLVSIVVLSIIMLAVVQIMNGALVSTGAGTKHMDADTQARVVLDRIAYDVSRMIKRPDVDYYFNLVTPGSDQMAFFSESGGYYPVAPVAAPSTTTPNPLSTVSLVGYRINTDTMQMERLSKGLVWNNVSAGVTAVPVNFALNSYQSLGTTILANWPMISAAGSTGADPNYQVIGDQVFRLEIAFLTQNNIPTSYTTYNSGLYSNIKATSSYLTTTPYSPTAASAWATDQKYVNSNYANSYACNGMHDVVAIVVSIAVLNAQSRAVLGNPDTVAGQASQAKALATAAAGLDDFTTPANSGQLSGLYSASSPPPSLPMTLWKADLNNAFANTPNLPLGLPPLVASQIRFYQRVCYLNPVQ